MSKVGALIILSCGAAMAANAAYAAHSPPRATQEIRATATSVSSSSTSSGSGGNSTSTQVPEIDPGTALSALMLLGASVAVLRGRRK
jgi:hypothetical protein